MAQTTKQNNIIPTDTIIDQFIRESNAIENVYDDQSHIDATHAYRYIMSITPSKLNESHIKQTHGILMRNKTHELSQCDIGNFRTESVYIGNRMGKPWYVVPELIEQWVRDMKTTIAVSAGVFERDRISLCREFHVRYEHIHPFIDGNGRTGRIFYNYHRIHMGLPIEIIRERNKIEYYQWFD